MYLRLFLILLVSLFLNPKDSYSNCYERDISYKFKVYRNLGKINYDLENHKWCEGDIKVQVGLD